jgi:ubiquinone/menaquinone biosynthesis C-methylase UbiE
MTDYLNVVYDLKSRPKTTYPGKLAHYLFHSFEMKKGQKFLEPGCGRGEFLSEFSKLGLECYGIDLSINAGSLSKDINVTKEIDLENQVWPYPDNYFDIIYNKSLLEHLHNPDKFLIEARRVLKPGGKILSLVPDWESNYKTYFDDFTHRTPFTKISLNDIYLMTAFKEINVYKFRQLPIVWRFPIINIFSSIISPLIPVRTKSKFLRWSRELMLIGYAEK